MLEQPRRGEQLFAEVRAAMEGAWEGPGGALEGHGRFAEVRGSLGGVQAGPLPPLPTKTFPMDQLGAAAYPRLP